MSNYDNNNTGVLFRQAEKQSEKHPDFTGNCEVNGKKMQIASWINTSKDGSKKYMSLKFSEFKPKEEVGSVSTTGDIKVEEIPF
tara:strand:+ start:398 stop:649 length:252 start_codon:yes stop_codon:yes gene_type:complete